MKPAEPDKRTDPNGINYRSFFRLDKRMARQPPTCMTTGISLGTRGFHGNPNSPLHPISPATMSPCLASTLRDMQSYRHHAQLSSVSLYAYPVISPSPWNRFLSRRREALGRKRSPIRFWRNDINKLHWKGIDTFCFLLLSLESESLCSTFFRLGSTTILAFHPNYCLKPFSRLSHRRRGERNIDFSAQQKVIVICQDEG